jgi:hypothetical protein
METGKDVHNGPGDSETEGASEVADEAVKVSIWLHIGI